MVSFLKWFGSLKIEMDCCLERIEVSDHTAQRYGITFIFSGSSVYLVYSPLRREDCLEEDNCLQVFSCAITFGNYTFFAFYSVK